MLAVLKHLAKPELPPRSWWNTGEMTLGEQEVDVERCVKGNAAEFQITSDVYQRAAHGPICHRWGGGFLYPILEGRILDVIEYNISI